MLLKNFINDLNLNKRDGIYLLIILIISILITWNGISNSIKFTTNSDVLAYLVNALRFAGLNGNIADAHNMYSTPVVCLLTAFLFKLGFVEKTAIFIVSGVFAILGTLGFYILLRQRFNGFLSFFGCVLFGSFNVMLNVWGNGGIDIPVCSIAIFVILFHILAVDKNPKYYVVTSILLVLAIFTKYVAFFLIPLLLLYYLSKHDFFNTVDLLLTDKKQFVENSKAFLKSEEFKYIILAVIIFIALFICFCALIVSNNGGLTFITQISESSSGFQGDRYSTQNGYHISSKYYLQNFNNMTYMDFYGDLDISWILPVIILIGTFLNLRNLDIKRPKREFGFKHLDKILVILIIALFAIALLEFKKSDMISNIAILISYVCVYSLLDKYGIDNERYGITILFLGWLSIYFIYFSYINIKMLRYFIIIVPPFVYFIVWSFDGILSSIKHEKILKIIIIIIMAILVMHAITFVSEAKLDTKRNCTDIEKVLDYLIEIDPDYESKNLYSNYSYYTRYSKWYLKTDVYKYWSNLTEDNATYIIAKAPVDFPEFEKIHKSGRVYLYRNTTQFQNVT